jgi:hypothetical protein
VFAGAHHRERGEPGASQHGQRADHADGDQGEAVLDVRAQPAWTETPRPCAESIAPFS